MTETPELSPNSTPDNAGKTMSGIRLNLLLRRIKLLAIRYWWILAITTVIGLIVQAYRCVEKAISYTSSSKMMVSGHVSGVSGAMYSEEMSYFYGTQVALMQSQDTKSQAIARVKAMHPEIAVDDNSSIVAAQEPRTSIFDLQVTSTNPEFAKLLLDSVMDTYLASKQGRKDQTTNGAVSAITEEISHLDAEIHNDEQQLLDFQKQNNVAFIEEQSTSVGNYLVGLNNELARLTKEHDLLSMENKTGTVPPTPAPVDNGTNSAPDATDTTSTDSDASVIAQQNEIEKLKIQRDSYGVYLKDKHPKMIALSDTIDKEQKFLEVLKARSATESDAHREDIGVQIKNLGQQIVEWNKKALDLSERLGTFEQLKNKVSREEGLYNQLASSIQNVKLDNHLDQDEQLSILQPASTAFALSPDYPRQLTYGVIFGLLGGMAIIYGIHRLDDKIDSSFGLEETIGYPIVGQIPFAIPDKTTNRMPLLTETDQRHVLVESYRNIRSSLLFRASGQTKPRSLMISSAVPGEGKSTLATNLAITFALSGTRVLLIDADMRRGLLHTLFKIESSPGLSEYLRQLVPWKDVVQKTAYKTLDLIPRGKIPHQPGDLLLGPVNDLLLHESVAEYDLVVWDSAPLLATDDAANLCSKVDGILFVGRVGHSSMHAIRSALDVLAQRRGNVFGLVINAVDADQPGYHDRYKYKEYYASVAEV